MKKSLLFVAAMLPVTANALLINGGFESGDLTGWTLVGAGSASVVMSDVTSTAGSIATGPTEFTTVYPTEGKFFGEFSTGSPNTTLLSSIFSAIGGDVFSVDLAFSSGDWGGTFNDAMTWSLNLIPAGVPVDASVVSDTDSIGAYGFTGWEAFYSIIPFAGNYQAAISVFDVGDNFLDSFAFVDNAKLTSATADVSLPGTLTLFGLGLVAVGVSTTRRRRKAIAS